jgi:hypothetical protein
MVAVGTGERRGRLELFVYGPDGLSLERAADQLLQSQQLEGGRVLSRGRRRIAGLDAVLVQQEGRRSGGAVRLTALVFVHQGFSYQLLLTGREVDDLEVRALLDGLDLLPGDVQPEWPVADTREARGVDWRVRARRFESAASGLIVEPGSRWRLISPAEIGQLHSDAEVGLVSVNPEVYLLLLPEGATAPLQLQFRRGFFAASGARIGQRTPSEDLTIQFDGHPLSLAGYVDGDWTSLLGVQCEGQDCTRVLVWWSGSASAAARQLLTASPPTFGRLRADARDALERELRASPPPARYSFEPEYSLHGDR